MTAPQGTDRRPAGISHQTALQKPVHPTLADLYLGNVTVPGRFEPHRFSGFVARIADVISITGAGAVREAYGLDLVDGWPKSGPLPALRFHAHDPLVYTTTYGGSTPEGARRMGTHVVYPAPFLGTGYTPSRDHAIPEYFVELTELPIGTELWQLFESGQDERLGVYQGRQVGWIRTNAPALGPRTWWEAPMPLRATVRRGLVVRFRGQEFDADFGPKPGQLTLHPLPGAPVPDDFANDLGIRTLVILDAQADQIGYLRQLCQWRGALFEVTDLDQHQAVLHFLGENYLVAQQLGLTEVDLRVWRAVAPRAEISEIRQDFRPIQPGLMRGSAH